MPDRSGMGWRRYCSIETKCTLRDARDEAKTPPVPGMVPFVANFPSVRNVVGVTLAFGTLWPVMRIFQRTSRMSFTTSLQERRPLQAVHR